MKKFHRVDNAVDAYQKDLNTISTKLKEQSDAFPEECFTLIPLEIDGATAYNFCVLYTLLVVEKGFIFASFCPNPDDLQWVFYRNKTENTRASVGRLLYREGAWKADSLAGNFTGHFSLDELIKSSGVVMM